MHANHTRRRLAASLLSLLLSLFSESESEEALTELCIHQYVRTSSYERRHDVEKQEQINEGNCLGAFVESEKRSYVVCHSIKGQEIVARTFPREKDFSYRLPPGGGA